MKTAYLLIFLAFWLAGVLDYAVQAPWWGWPVPIDMLARGPKWVWFLDWFPRDAWHIAQFLRNLLWIGGAALGGWYLAQRWRWYISLGIILGIYVLARGLSSSLILQIVR